MNVVRLFIVNAESCYLIIFISLESQMVITSKSFALSTPSKAIEKKRMEISQMLNLVHGKNVTASYSKRNPPTHSSDFGGNLPIRTTCQYSQ